MPLSSLDLSVANNEISYFFNHSCIVHALHVHLIYYFVNTMEMELYNDKSNNFLLRHSNYDFNCLSIIYNTTTIIYKVYF